MKHGELIQKELDAIEKIIGFPVLIKTRDTLADGSTSYKPFYAYDEAPSDDKFHNLQVRIVSGNEITVAHFRHRQYLGCCGMAIHGCKKMSYEYARRGLNKHINRIQRLFAKNLGYSILLAADKTASMGNLSPNKINVKSLKKVGYKPILSFTNRRTRNPVELLAFDLNAWNEEKEA